MMSMLFALYYPQTFLQHLNDLEQVSIVATRAKNGYAYFIVRADSDDDIYQVASTGVIIIANAVFHWNAQHNDTKNPFEIIFGKKFYIDARSRRTKERRIFVINYTIYAKVVMTLARIATGYEDSYTGAVEIYSIIRDEAYSYARPYKP